MIYAGIEKPSFITGGGGSSIAISINISIILNALTPLSVLGIIKYSVVKRSRKPIKGEPLDKIINIKPYMAKHDIFIRLILLVERVLDKRRLRKRPVRQLVDKHCMVLELELKLEQGIYAICTPAPLSKSKMSSARVN
ncbi:uncharacterized protein MCYG_08026 [Microsporum canis CBS 113480]|uniref:Uncharacterized protein n=1 Tax=Arthroderma otae (strain ATCC MYA-4605 / CBS 113480) TaxID=554155 RepID=C5FZA4_ARTOC|nr:uncharacterized protein MCYG_08026 [Microsporum canis CBS 113480]EEQ35207.1 predicted protein [Microsporum canis CBS 113480]